MSHSFPHYHQLDAMDCGPTCLRMVAQKRTAKIQKSTVRERLRKRRHDAGAPAGKRERLFNLKMKEK